MFGQIPDTLEDVGRRRPAGRRGGHAGHRRHPETPSFRDALRPDEDVLFQILTNGTNEGICLF
jgi:hypothetical protein